ncbi:ABC transporter ATP-binding protein [Caldimonas thermodepolymerans]|jgi:ABC-type sugar transport systems, ATPase components|uniref:ABC transporter ATP-binding protein n=1 Tax=Caldimonas thermodepolymerans TaxID=215580 RepID=A0A2S5T575_9BURK|nr:ABC transporter ATP-binding protein [Caldimonas thermodepolymerans]PPE70048.1 ABC transporter ATP-binding protein [Caldimonas thermodepolymerans]QPC31789.1 ABC transporter ATP-binding protein [Caldimonas thermodepolymerans]RDI01706.1 carbohydrate ABC transporter ATP-binding protein (CUT1 family) [Caldimonas thermodepolymerans]TCP05844.1 carbohydrate ABC transporter ATP-binding protein (CUT1 family) [Caldimonas thermodepolymerans]UZG48216.1 ABC transporter ATP-binding protein [Caldimonas the
MASVCIEDLQVRMGPVSILENLNLKVEEGEFLVLLGPSGCGKSTLLHSIAGLLDVHAGRIEIAGEDVTWADPKDRSIGMVFQSYALYPTMSVERNMSFGLRIAGVPKDEIARRVKRAAEMLHLGDLLHRKPSQLSGGQRQRVAIGRALVREAAVFLFDEPLSNLDAKLRAELRRELKQLHKELRSTMIYVTHDQVEAMTLASRIAVMKDGRIQQIGSPADVYHQPANMFVAGFLGAPGMNFVEGRLGFEGGRARFTSACVEVDLGSYPFQAAPPHGAQVVLGIRPEHVMLKPVNGAQTGTARVALVEPMGAHLVTWLDARGQSIAVQSAADLDVRPDQVVGFEIDVSKVSVFDAATQRRL